MNRDIARFNKRITIQKNTTTIDKNRNHFNTWADYYSCWAYAGTYQFDKEEQGEAKTDPEQTINFEVRFCSEVKHLASDRYRVIFDGAIYDIIAVDNMNYQDETVKIRCKFQKAVSA